MSEAKPDPSGSTAAFRAFVEKGDAEPVRRGGLRSPATIALAVLAMLVVVVAVVLAVR